MLHDIAAILNSVHVPICMHTVSLNVLTCFTGSSIVDFIISIDNYIATAKMASLGLPAIDMSRWKKHSRSWSEDDHERASKMFQGNYKLISSQF